MRLLSYTIVEFISSIWLLRKLGSFVLRLDKYFSEISIPFYIFVDSKSKLCGQTLD